MIITNIEGHVVDAIKVNLFVIKYIYICVHCIDTTLTSYVHNKTPS